MTNRSIGDDFVVEIESCQIRHRFQMFLCFCITGFVAWPMRGVAVFVRDLASYVAGDDDSFCPQVEFLMKTVLHLKEFQ